jgi:hypothetical protein
MMALTPDGIRPGWRAVDAEASELQPQDGQTVALCPSRFRSPQHIGQVLPYTLMPRRVLQDRNG